MPASARATRTPSSSSRVCPPPTRVRIGQCVVAAPGGTPGGATHRHRDRACTDSTQRFHSVLAETDLGLRAYAAGLGRSVMVPGRRDHLPHRLRAARRADRRDVVAPATDHAHPPPTTPRRCWAGPARGDSTSAIAGSPPTPTTRSRARSCVPELVDAARGRHPRVAAHGCGGRSTSLRPPAARGDRWGDTYFARSLADALERRGQHVAVDRRDARRPRLPRLRRRPARPARPRPRDARDRAC